MSHFTLKIATNNAAFDDEYEGREELARLLRKVAERVQHGDSMDKHRNITDSNGNIVGTFVHKES